MIRAIEQASARFGQIDFAANCAGADINSDLVEYTEADFDTIFNVNVESLFFC